MLPIHILLYSLYSRKLHQMILQSFVLRNEMYHFEVLFHLASLPRSYMYQAHLQTFRFHFLRLEEQELPSIFLQMLHKHLTSYVLLQLLLLLLREQYDLLATKIQMFLRMDGYAFPISLHYTIGCTSKEDLSKI